MINYKLIRESLEIETDFEAVANSLIEMLTPDDQALISFGRIPHEITSQLLASYIETYCDRLDVPIDCADELLAGEEVNAISVRSLALDAVFEVSQLLFAKVQPVV